VNWRVGRGRTAMAVARSNVVDSQHNPKQEYAPGYQFPSAVVGDYGLISATGSRPAPGSISGWVLPLGGLGVCPDLITAGGGEREEYLDVPTVGLTGGLPRYPAAGGVGVRSGGGEAATLCPPWRAACLLFWNLRKRFTIQKSQIRCRQGRVLTKFGHFEVTCPSPSPIARVLLWTGTQCDYRQN
jgi:hypothetical protein